MSSIPTLTLPARYILKKKKAKSFDLAVWKGLSESDCKTCLESGRRQNVSKQQRMRLSISGAVFPTWPHMWDYPGKAHALSLTFTTLEEGSPVLTMESNPRNRNRQTSQKRAQTCSCSTSGWEIQRKPGGPHPSSLSTDLSHKATVRGSMAVHRYTLCRGRGQCEEGLSARESHQKLASLKESRADCLQGAEQSKPHAEQAGGPHRLYGLFQLQCPASRSGTEEAISSMSCRAQLQSAVRQFPAFCSLQKGSHLYQPT